MKIKLLLMFLFSLSQGLAQEKFVAITMDDMPFNTLSRSNDLLKVKQINEALLEKIKQQQTPVAAFINGNGILKPGEADERLHILNLWVQHPYITLGNHTVHHWDLNKTDLDAFKEDIINNEFLIQSVAENEEISYFRFPYNHLGETAEKRRGILSFLDEKGYISAPFTIESVDYMFNALYVHALKEGKAETAKALAMQYIDFTVQSFEYFEALTHQLHGRSIKHIYLCHSNQLHADYYDQLIERLRKLGYKFLSLEEVLKDPIYENQDFYEGKHGISWLFRWIEDPEKRQKLLRESLDPDMNLFREYQDLSK